MKLNSGKITLAIHRNTIIAGRGPNGTPLHVGPGQLKENQDKKREDWEPQLMEFDPQDYLDAYRLIAAKKAKVVKGDASKLRRRMSAKAQQALVGTEVRS